MRRLARVAGICIIVKLPNTFRLSTLQANGPSKLATLTLVYDVRQTLVVVFCTLHSWRQFSQTAEVQCSVYDVLTRVYTSHTPSHRTHTHTREVVKLLAHNGTSDGGACRARRAKLGKFSAMRVAWVLWHAVHPLHYSHNYSKYI